MARKEINIFSVSFLDLLSGALGAVLILFVVIPKMTAEEQNAIEVLQELDVQAENIAQMIEQLENSVDEEIYRAIEEQLNAIQAEVESLQETVAELREQVQRDQQRITELEGLLAACEARTTELEQQNAALEAQQQASSQQIAQLQQEVERLVEPPPPGPSGPGGKIFGLNADFAAVAEWSEAVDVDLWLRNNSSGEWCYFGEGHTETDFARYMQDVRTQDAENSKYELIYQDEIQPGSYDLYIHLYTGTDGVTADVDGYVTIFPYTNREQKIEFSRPGIRHNATPNNGGGIRIGTITLTENNISLQ